MKVPYSPYNKSYKYLTLQNQLAHVKNLQNTSGLVQTNLSIVSPISNTSFLRKSAYKHQQAHKRSVSSNCTIDCTTYAKLQQSPRIIHMNYSFNKKQQSNIKKQNQRLARKLQQTKCRVETVKQTARQFSKHQKYEGLRRRYSQQIAKRKDLVTFVGQPLQASRLRNTRYYGEYCTVDKQLLNCKNRPSTAKPYKRWY